MTARRNGGVWHVMRALAVAVLGALALGLAACGGSGEAPADGPTGLLVVQQTRVGDDLYIEG